MRSAVFQDSRRPSAGCSRCRKSSFAVIIGMRDVLDDRREFVRSNRAVADLWWTHQPPFTSVRVTRRQVGRHSRKRCSLCADVVRLLARRGGRARGIIAMMPSSKPIPAASRTRDCGSALPRKCHPVGRLAYRPRTRETAASNPLIDSALPMRSSVVRDIAQVKCEQFVPAYRACSTCTVDGRKARSSVVQANPIGMLKVLNAPRRAGLGDHNLVGTVSSRILCGVGRHAVRRSVLRKDLAVAPSAHKTQRDNFSQRR